MATTPTLTLAYWLTHHPEATGGDTIDAQAANVLCQAAGRSAAVARSTVLAGDRSRSLLPGAVSS
ncbi:hypothetical protein ACFYMW_09505 [Streptomyces sp. NPDC006692]|uniref:hypothetical protein n=1 Tax=Streptomyces sp. NPDC006692 TaxID=3364758 RepID=UPI0036C1A6C6